MLTLRLISHVGGGDYTDSVGVLPKLWTKAMLGFSQVEENRDEEGSLYGRANSIDITGS